MQKFFILIFILFEINLMANINNEEIKILSPHIDKIFDAIPELEKDYNNSKLKYKNLEKKLNNYKQELKKNTNFFAKKKLELQIYYYDEKVIKSAKELELKKLEIYIYYCILSSFNKRQISKAEFTEAKKLIPQMKKRHKNLLKEEAKIKRKLEETNERVREIPSEIIESEEELKSLNKKLSVLEYKKSWSNVAERAELISKIGYHKSKLIKLKGEILILEQIEKDTAIEEKSKKIERIETQVAIKFLN